MQKKPLMNSMPIYDNDSPESGQCNKAHTWQTHS